MVKAECGKSLDSTSTAQDAEINQTIANIQSWLASAYDWPFLKNRWDSFLTPSSRYQAFPTQNTLGVTTAPVFERPPIVDVKWNQIWQPVLYGIDEYPEFNYLDSDRGQILDPIQRWQFNDETQFEVWPLPASTAQLRFIGQRKLTTLLSSTNPIMWNDSATLDLDDLLLTYFVATDYLEREENQKASIEAAKAQKQLMALLGAYPVRSDVVTIGRGAPMDRKMIRQVPMVLVAGGK